MGLGPYMFANLSLFSNINKSNCFAIWTFFSVQFSRQLFLSGVSKAANEMVVLEANKFNTVIC